MSEQVKLGYAVAILGATGAVGTRLIEQLEQSTIPVRDLRLLASERSAGQTREFRGETYTIEVGSPEAFDGIDLVLSSPGGAVSKALLPEAVKRGAVAVDNSSYWRMHDDVPLVVPEVNEAALQNHHGIIANPNCSTIQMAVALAPIYEHVGLKQVIVSTYQAASGAGQEAWEELNRQAQQHLDGDTMTGHILPVKGDVKHFPLAFNLLPQIDVFEEADYTHEEWKMIRETKKIMTGDKFSTAIKVTGTAVRVPVAVGHGESVYFEVEQDGVTSEEIQNLLAAAPGVVLQDDPAHQIYPQPIEAEGKRETFVGRVRADVENPGNFHMWVVSDNLLKGAAWNTVQIAERLVANDLLHVSDEDRNYFIGQ